MNNPMQALFDKLGDRIGEEGARVRALIEAGLTQTLNGQRITGARPVPIAAGGRLATGRGRLTGWSLRETAGAAATVTVYAAADGLDPASIIATVPLAANAGSTHFPSNPGIFYAEGVFVVVTGAVTGALHFAAVD